MKGSIKVLKTGFGFIKSDEVENDVFFHANNLVWIAFDELTEWQTVSFEIGEWKNWKQQAIDVKVEA